MASTRWQVHELYCPTTYVIIKWVERSRKGCEDLEDTNFTFMLLCIITDLFLIINQMH